MEISVKIEIMISIIIMSTLAFITIPSYLNNKKLARFSVVVEAAGTMKDPVAACAQFMGTVMGCNGDTTSAGKVTSLSIKNGVITAVGNALAGEYTYQLTPTYNAATNVITWQVSGTCIAAGFCNN